MVAALLKETRITLPEAARMFPGHNTGKPIGHSSVWRWRVKGIKAANGRRVRLEAFRAGRCWYTTVEAVTRFIETLSAVPEDDQAERQEPVPAGR